MPGAAPGNGGGCFRPPPPPNYGATCILGDLRRLVNCSWSLILSDWNNDKPEQITCRLPGWYPCKQHFLGQDEFKTWIFWVFWGLCIEGLCQVQIFVNQVQFIHLTAPRCRQGERQRPETQTQDPVSQDQTTTVQFLRRRCVVLKFQDQTTTSLCGPENFLGPDNDCLGLNSNRSLCGPR